MPDDPPDDDYWVIDFVFNAVESPDYDSIIQPVLEWNYKRTYHWTGAAWYIIEGEDGVRADDINCDEGDQLYGYLMRSESQEKWRIKIRNMDTGENSILYTDSGDFPIGNNLKIFCALEGYYIDDDDDVPGDIHFDDMEIEDKWGDPINVSWRGYTPGENWGLTDLEVDVISDEEVILYTAN